MEVTETTSVEVTSQCQENVGMHLPWMALEQAKSAVWLFTGVYRFSLNLKGAACITLVTRSRTKQVELCQLNKHDLLLKHLQASMLRNIQPDSGAVRLLWGPIWGRIAVWGTSRFRVFLDGAFREAFRLTHTERRAIH